MPHRQFVFTIPKILRPYFRNDKRLFGEISRLIFSLLSEFFSLSAGQELLGAMVVSYQSFGEFARFLSMLRNPAPLESRPLWRSSNRATSMASRFGGKSLQVFAISVPPHPHWHVLVLEGGFTDRDHFVYLPLGACEGIRRVLQAAMLALFLRKNLIDQARAGMLKSWQHLVRIPQGVLQGQDRDFQGI